MVSPGLELGRLELAREVTATVTDPELPMLTLVDLGVLREVDLDETGTVVVDLAPTYSGCPAMATMRDDLVRVLDEVGLEARVRVVLDPPWTSDDITPLGPVRRHVTCPRCGSTDTALTSEFGSTACKALYRCRACLEPFDHVKEI